MFDFNIFDRLLQLNIGVAQSDNQKAFELMSMIHPINIKKYRSGEEYNGWVIPRDWQIRKALIKKGGKVMFNGMCHPLAVAGYSTSFIGVLSKEELDKHVFFSKICPQAYAFHCANNYRPWVQQWGFCVPYDDYKNWGSGEYSIELETEFRDGEMLVGECWHKGALSDTIVFNAHTCHPCQANDDMSGVIVILELFKWLKTQKTHYTYLGVLAPEHLGTVFYLSNFSEEQFSSLKLGCFLESVGTATPLALQKSFTGESIIDEVAEYVLKEIEPALTVGCFRTLVGNDETVWEAPGIEVPMISIQRTPYKEYHTSDDHLGIMSVEKLTETLDVLKNLVDILERDRSIQRQFRGLVSLSNPKYDLYVERPEPTVKKELSEIDLKFGKMQDHLPRYFNGTRSIFQLASKFGVPFDKICAYVEKFETKGLVMLLRPNSLDYYKTSVS